MLTLILSLINGVIAASGWLRWILLGALTLASGLFEFTKPVFKWLGESFVSIFGFGLADIFDNMKTVITVLTLLSIATFGGYEYRKVNYPSLDLDFRATYRVVPRTHKERSAYLKRANKSEWDVFWSRWF